MNGTAKKIIAVCAAALVIVIIAVFSAARSGGQDVFSDAVNYITAPVKSFASSVVDRISEFTEHLTNYDSLIAENESLYQQIAELQESYLQYVEYKEENERLRNLLGLAENNPTYEFAEGRIIAWTASNWNSSFTINAGTAAGISAGDCAIDEYGHLIGLVSSVNENSSVITTILDTSSNIGATVIETGDSAVASGRFDLFPENRLALTYMPDDHEIVNGQVAVISGVGGIAPSGIMIGTVVDMAFSSSGLSDYAVIEPAADFDNLTTIFVITSY